MRKKIIKGEPGYFKKRKLQTGIAMVTGYLMVLLLFFTGIFIFADRRNLFSAGAIILMLPTAKMTVQYLMFPRKSSANADEFLELKELAGNLPVVAELYITPEKKNIELTYAAFSKGQIIIFSQDRKLDGNYHKKFIKDFLGASGFSAEVSFYDDLEKFKKRLKGLKRLDGDGELDELVHTFLIMSI